MATARCYTKSGNVEKYELNCFSGAVNHYPIDFTHHIIGPNSNGNYTITYEGYDDGNSSNYDCYCKTIYGADWRNGKGEIKTFYFKKAIKEILIHSGVGFFTNTGLEIFLTFNGNKYLENDKLNVVVEVTANNPNSFIDSINFTVDKNSIAPLKVEILNPSHNRVYSTKIISCQPMKGKNYKVSLT